MAGFVNKINYKGTEKEISPYVEITYSNLVSLRNSSGLTPGQSYRITDYVTTTSQDNTQSAGHQFDIIVVADSVNKLNEKARACLHSGDTYFSACTLSAWQIWYCLDNDTNRFMWAQNYLSPVTHQKMIRVNDDGMTYIYVRYPSLDNGQFAWIYDSNADDKTFKQYVDNGEENLETGDVIYTQTESPKIGDVLDMTGTEVTMVETSWGKGVIYRMIDEWGNDCPYDFKNIQFPRYKITACPKSPDLVGLYSKQGANGITVDTSTTYWCFTFSMINLFADVIDDVSVFQNKYPNDESFYYKQYNNVFKPYYYDDYDRDPILELMSLPNNVFVTDTDICGIGDDYSYGDFYGFYSNTFGNGCYSNTFGSGCRSNTFGNDCYSNTFGNGCRSNTFGNYFQSNTIGNYYQNNTIGNGCYSNTFGNDCGSNTFGNGNLYNTFGNGCGSNTFGNNCRSNTFGNYCESNTFGNDCGSNTFGNYYQSNTFGNYSQNNTFGNNCRYNTFGNNCRFNTFGNGCYNNTFGNSCQHITFNKDYSYYNIVENGNQYIDVTSTQTTSTALQLRNVTIAQGVNNTTTRKTISHNTVNDTFKTTYQPQNSQVISV